MHRVTYIVTEEGRAIVQAEALEEAGEVEPGI
jgi:hypothetical protein